MERIKCESRYLRGRLAEELASDEDAFTADTGQLLKHHGDVPTGRPGPAEAKDAEGKRAAKAYSLMVRVKIPGGRLTSGQFLAQLDLCDELGNATARITDRQDIQLHGDAQAQHPPGDPAHQRGRAHDAGGLRRRGAKRDVLPGPFQKRPGPPGDAGVGGSAVEPPLAADDGLSRDLALRDQLPLVPATAEKVRCGSDAEEHEVEPLYGVSYLPRKFKIVLALPGDNCVDVYANDLGLLALTETSEVFEDFGSLRSRGLPHRGLQRAGGRRLRRYTEQQADLPRRRPTAWPSSRPTRCSTLPPRSSRCIAISATGPTASGHGIKYLIADWGLQRFRAKVEEYYGRPLADPQPRRGLRLRRSPGLARARRRPVVLRAERGERPDSRPRRIPAQDGTARDLRDVQPGIRLTPHQSILFSDIAPDSRAGLEAMLRRHGVKLSEEISNVRRWSMACVALPTCPLAVTESERVLSGPDRPLEAELPAWGWPASGSPCG